MYSTFAVVLFLLSGVAWAVEPCTDAMVEEVDKCGQTLYLIGQTGTKLPTSMEEMENLCVKLKSSQTCILDYSNNCLESLAKQVTTTIVKSATQQTSGYCDTEEQRQEFISHTTCYNEDIEKLHQCMESHIDRLEGLSKAPKAEKIPLTCCNFYKFRNCIISNITRIGEPVCSRSDATFMTNILNGFSAELLDLLCGTTPENCEACKTLVSPIKDEGKPRSKSILPPFIKTFTHL